jgi:hypothetical protein
MCDTPSPGQSAPEVRMKIVASMHKNRTEFVAGIAMDH